MLTVRHRPELATPTLWDYLKEQLGSYEGSGGQTGKWLWRTPALMPPMLKDLAEALDPGRVWRTAHCQGYEDGRAQTPCHTDRAGDTVILSLGATRTLRVHRVQPGTQAQDDCTGNRDLDVFEIECASGTVVAMDEEFYRDWHHWVPPEPDRTGERLSLVFRAKTREG